MNGKALLKSQIQSLAMLLALVMIWVVFDNLTDGSFLQARNLSNLFRQMAVTGILACGMVLVIVSGQIDLSVGSLAAVLGGVLAVSDVRFQNPTVALLITFGCGLGLGYLQGLLSTKFRIPAFIVTLGGMMSFRGAAMWITSNSTIPISESWVSHLGTDYFTPNSSLILIGLGVLVFWILSFISLKKPTTDRGEIILRLVLVTGIISLAAIVFSRNDGLPYPVFIMIIVAIVLHIFSQNTIWGRHLYAIGGNVEAAYLSGIPVKKTTRFVFILMGLLSALSGTILTARVGSASPDAGGLLELDAIAACVIGGTSLMGGKGTIFGAILGALVIESLNNGMSLANMEPYWQYLLKGLVLVVAVGIDVASRGKKEIFD